MFVFFYAAARRATLVPGRLQFAGESAYGIVRDSMAATSSAATTSSKFVPYLVTVFFFILINNAFASIHFHPVPDLLACLGWPTRWPV